VTTCGDLDKAIGKAEASGTGAHIEVVTAKYAAAPLAKKLHESLDTLYSA
jgi:indolepyruvate decarboxylase